MPATQAELDAALSRQHLIPVQFSEDAPIPEDNSSYDQLRLANQNGLEITVHELIHAIGSKTAALPSSSTDECIRAGLLYTYILDFDCDVLALKPGMDPDLKTPRSQEIGIGMMCLVASKIFGVPWDHLEALPGPGKRFDYGGFENGFDGIFESKGTSRLGYQSNQIINGIEKKAAHHQRGEQFNVELIISTFVGSDGNPPRILVGDPEFDELARIYSQLDKRYFRLRHYARVLQFIGLPQSSFHLRQEIEAYVKGENELERVVFDEKHFEGKLSTETFGDHRYFGRWFETVVPEDSKRHSRPKFRGKLLQGSQGVSNRSVFQGLREDIYSSSMYGQAFSHDLLKDLELQEQKKKIEEQASLFPDGTIQVFRIL